MAGHDVLEGEDAGEAQDRARSDSLVFCPERGRGCDCPLRLSLPSQDPQLQHVLPVRVRVTPAHEGLHQTLLLGSPQRRQTASEERHLPLLQGRPQCPDPASRLQ